MIDLPNMPDNSFDLALVDPPYGLNQNLARVKRRCRLAGTKVTENFDWDKSIPTDEYFYHLQRVSKRQIIWGANYFPYLGRPFKTPRRKDYGSWLMDHPIDWIIWDKVNGNCHYNDCELAMVCNFEEPISSRIFYYMWNGMMQGKQSFTDGHIMEGNRAIYEPKIHPTQKPITLYKWVYSHYARSGWSVLDTHNGSGSNAIAAYSFGVDFTGYEKSPRHFWDSKDWIMRYTQPFRDQLNLFETSQNQILFEYEQ